MNHESKISRERDAYNLAIFFQKLKKFSESIEFHEKLRPISLYDRLVINYLIILLTYMTDFS